MFPLSIFLFFATALPPQQDTTPQLHFDRIPQAQQFAPIYLFPRKSIIMDQPPLASSNDCYMIRTYHFQRHDGQAPVLTGMTTCTPGSLLRQKKAAPAPGKFVPLTFGGEQR
ncbi:MAG TPA: hypothetical protein VFT65_01610 [Candidatus Angelobacter sp.]|nr:hypothetical protein [Candidatus Angelobacter sp.]